jgi:hypothetical protein
MSIKEEKSGLAEPSSKSQRNINVIINNFINNVIILYLSPSGGLYTSVKAVQRPSDFALTT